MTEDRSPLFAILFHLCMWWPIIPIIAVIVRRKRAKKPAMPSYPDDDAVE